MRHFASLLVYALLTSMTWGQEPTETTAEELFWLHKNREWADLTDRLAYNDALAHIGPEAVPALIEALSDEELCSLAAETLGNIGPDARAAVPALITALSDDELFQIAAGALGKIGPDAGAAVPALIEALSEWELRRSAAAALGRIGPDARAAVPALIDLLKHEDGRDRSQAAGALGGIAAGLQDRKDISSLPDLEDALLALIDARLRDEFIRPVRLAVEALRAMDENERNRWYNVALEWGRDNPWYARIAIGELGLLAIWIMLLVFSPLTLLRINDGLDALFNEKMKIQYKGFEGSALVKFPLLVGFFHYHRRVLDGWVNKHIDTARKNFNEKETVARRLTHVPIPVVLDGNALPTIGPEQIRDTCKKPRWRVLIHGEGGAGKTSLACQMAHWAMASDKAKRLSDHRMLPVLIEQELDLTVENPRHRFREAIRGQLQDLVGEAETISSALLKRLLRKQRVLVIVDHFSEMSEDTRKAMRPGDPEFLPFALVVTSRLDEKLDGVRKTTIKPRRIDGNRLSSFMESYLTLLGQRELFDDAEYFDACRKLSLMVAERDITVLLAKLYADQMVSIKKGADDGTLPDNIPDMMLQYLNILNRDGSDDDPDNATVQKVAKIVAWECIRRTYRPGPALREDILSALKHMDDAKGYLKHLEKRLRVIRTTGVSDESVLFELDPLAEYLAGLHVVESYRDSEERWDEFFSQADAQDGAPESIKGFLLAVRDCCLAKKKKTECNIPDSVVEKLGKRTGLDPDVLRQAHLQQRVQRLITGLHVPEAEDRVAAAEALGQIGPDAKAAVPALSKVLKDDNEDLCWYAIVALRKIGPEAVPALSQALKDKDDAVRWQAADALGTIGPHAKSAVPALMEALQNKNVSVRDRAAMALGKIGPNAKAAVPALIEVLNDESSALSQLRIRVILPSCC